MVFTGTFDDLDFPVKPVKFSFKNWQNFLKESENYLQSFHLLGLFKENLLIYKGKCNEVYRKI